MKSIKTLTVTSGIGAASSLKSLSGIRTKNGSSSCGAIIHVPLWLFQRDYTEVK
ncbi:hypothetical protein [Providencia rettgeri]|uniref:hypothetical protein n=1 Tax=Providencia rettgeri TaxID=587 RepID=UPI003AF32FE4